MKSGTVANSVCIALLAFAFYCDFVTRNFEAPLSNPVSRATSSEFNVHAVVRLRHKSPHGKGIECAESFLVQKSSAMLNQCRQSIIHLARDVMVAEDRLRVLMSQFFSVRSPLAFCDSSVFICVICGQQCDSIPRAQRSAIRRSQHD